MNIRLILCFVIVFFYNSISFSGEKIKLYALYTPSHEMLKDQFFLPSMQDDFEIVMEFSEQTCPTAEFMSEGWTKTTMRKVDIIIQAIKENWGKVFIYSDVDIQFFRPIQSTILMLMKNKDIVLQRNNPAGVLCTGFFACRGNKKTLALWTDVKKTMQTKQLQSDQISFNQCIQRRNKKNPYDVAWDYLPDTFFGGGTLTAYSGYLWSPGKSLPVPAGIMMHHANWTKGIENKVAQLIYVQNEVRKQQHNI